jgi:hypothetical protein
MFLKQKHKYVYLIWRKRVNYFSKPCQWVRQQSEGEKYTSVGRQYLVADESLASSLVVSEGYT